MEGMDICLIFHAKVTTKCLKHRTGLYKEDFISLCHSVSRSHTDYVSR